MLVRPFSIDVSQELLDELYVRLARIKWPSEATIAVLADVGTGPPGLPVDWLRRLMERWLGGFDWPTQQARLNRLPQVQVQLGGQFVHAVHLRGRGPSPMPLLLCHGWPSSFAEFTEMVPRLTDPVAFGGDPDDAFSVVVPSLPGLIFSTPLPAGHSTDVVDLFADLMRQLGYETFGVHGVDLGSFVAHRLALDHPNRIRGLHTTYPAEPPGVDKPTLAEAEFLCERPVGLETGGGYSHVQRTRPLTLAYGLTDSPLALAAWLLDKWRDWADCDGDLDRRFTDDQLLTMLTLYWVTDCVGTSLAFYRDWGLGAPATLVQRLYPRSLPGVEPRPLPKDIRVEIPAAVASFDQRYPETFVNRSYADLRRYTPMPRGGHFAALEEPDLLTADIRAFFKSLR